MVVRSWFSSIFRILGSKDQGNDQAQNTDGCHHSEDRGDAKLTFQDRQNKDARVAPILATPAAKPLAVARNCVGNKMGARVNVGGIRSSVH